MTHRKFEHPRHGSLGSLPAESASCQRGKGYNVEEDVRLCQIYLDMCKGGMNQSNNFWQQLSNTYNETKHAHWQFRNTRSVNCRMKTMLKAVRKLNVAIKQVKTTMPSDTSEQNIVNEGKMILVQGDKEFERGYKFDHAWNMLKNMEILQDHGSAYRRRQLQQQQQLNASTFVNNVLSEPDASTPEIQVPESQKSSAFSIDLNEGSSRSNSESEQSVRVKKAKMKKKAETLQLTTNEEMIATNKQLVKLLVSNNLIKKEQMETEKHRLAFEIQKEEDEFLCKDFSTISNPIARAAMIAKQNRIAQRRACEEEEKAQIEFNATLNQNYLPNG